MGGPGSGAKPRDYPAELVELVRHLYVDCRMTVHEIQRVVTGAKVQNIIARYGIPSRRPGKRDQWGERNHAWKGDAAGYTAVHDRIHRRYGLPDECDWCGRVEGRFEWANLTGRYYDETDYARLCISCHRRYDNDRRRRNGGRSTREGVVPHV